MDPAWPSFAEAEDMAKRASSFDLRLRLSPRKNGYAWTWLHVWSGIEFDGITSACTREVALIVALQHAPIIGR